MQQRMYTKAYQYKVTVKHIKWQAAKQQQQVIIAYLIRKAILNAQ